MADVLTVPIGSTAITARASDLVSFLADSINHGAIYDPNVRTDITTYSGLASFLARDAREGCRRGQGGLKCTKSDIINLYCTHRDTICLKR